LGQIEKLPKKANKVPRKSNLKDLVEI